MQAGQAPAHKHIDKLKKYVSDADVQLDTIITHRLLLSEAPWLRHVSPQKERLRESGAETGRVAP